MTVLAVLGLTVKTTDAEAEEHVLRIAEGKIRGGLEVVQWIAAREEAP